MGKICVFQTVLSAVYKNGIRLLENAGISALIIMDNSFT